MAEVVRVKAKRSSIDLPQPVEAFWAHGKFWVRRPEFDGHWEGNGSKVWFDYYPDEVEPLDGEVPPEPLKVIDVGETLKVDGVILKKVARDGVYIEVGAR